MKPTPIFFSDDVLEECWVNVYRIERAGDETFNDPGTPWPRRQDAQQLALATKPVYRIHVIPKEPF